MRLTPAWTLALLCAFAIVPASAFAAGPYAVITGGPQGNVASQQAQFTFGASSPAPFARLECRLDGGPWERCSSPKTYTGLIGGPHRFEVRLFGLLVNGAPAVRVWVVALGTQTVPCSLAQPCPNPQPPSSSKPRPRKRRDAGGCAYGGNRVGEVSSARLDRAVACLISKLRVRRGLPPLRRSRALVRAAARHAHDMVARHFFSHASLDGSSPADRIRRTGYLSGARFWAVGEVIAYSSRSFTPSAVVRAWLRSPPHRRVMLTAAFRQVGAGLVRGTSRSSRRGATGVANFGRRG